jgi:hypothetical protein
MRMIVVVENDLQQWTSPQVSHSTQPKQEVPLGKSQLSTVQSEF